MPPSIDGDTSPNLPMSPWTIPCRVWSNKRLFRQWKRQQNAMITLIFQSLSLLLGPLHLILSRERGYDLPYLMSREWFDDLKAVFGAVTHWLQTDIERHLSSYGSYVHSYTNPPNPYRLTLIRRINCSYKFHSPFVVSSTFRPVEHSSTKQGA